MIVVRLTENYGGFQIEGNFDDLNQFYDDLGSIIGFEESLDDDIEIQRLLVLGLMYDIRHAYQGDRMVKLNNEFMPMSNAEDWRQNLTSGVRFAFNYLLLDFLADYIIVRSKLFPMKESAYGVSYEDLTSAHYRVVSVFAQAVEELVKVLTPIQGNKLKRFLDEASKMRFTVYHGLWLEINSMDYLKMTSKQRQQNIVRCVNAMCEPYRYDDFCDMRNDVDAYAERNHCTLRDIHTTSGEDYANILW